MKTAKLYRRQVYLVHAPIWALAVLLFFILASRWMPMPPTHMTISSGPAGGMYQAYGLKYAQTLQSHGITAKPIESAGTGENINRITDVKADVQAAFVQGGYALSDANTQLGGQLETIAQIDVEPILLLTRIKDLDSLLTLRGMRVAVGAEGSGSRAVALRMFEQVRLETKDLILSSLGMQEAAAALSAGKIDAMLFVVSPTAPALRTLLQTPGIHISALRHSAALIERMPYLDARFVSAGSLIPGINQPAQDMNLLSAVASLVVREDLHPMIKRALADAALQLHSGAGPLHRAGEFPHLKRVEYPSSTQSRDVLRNGLPKIEASFGVYWAQWVYRLILIGLPLFLLAMLLSRLVPSYLRWRMERAINRWYGELKFIENDLKASKPGGLEMARFRSKLRDIDLRASGFEPPRSFMQRLYVLQQHVKFVNAQLKTTHGR